MPIDAGGPAFSPAWKQGVTIRDWVAGQALSGLLADPTTDIPGMTHRRTAVECYRWADAMMAARPQEPE